MESSRSLQKFQEVDTYCCQINCQQRRELHFPYNSPRRPKPPESDFFRTGGLGRGRAHRVLNLYISSDHSLSFASFTVCDASIDVIKIPKIKAPKLELL
ncbi:hypothetical protein AVEN_263550-1 [Araneus ventricosus]|uniref:Uncharacterized protein n=1 Tax=Araneus ventricosus TaxID=182803 RepID=A0A4Y2JYM4_ARAVE|nr:hypothetical protein AVEN_263550-1 [Araneus ventricosus]